MRLLSTLYAIAAISGALSVVAATPIQGFLHMFRHTSSPQPLEERQVYNCTDPQADFAEQCWSQLGLSDYLMNPTTGWNVTTPMCSTADDGTDSDGSNCCKPDQPWTTCYLHLAHGFAGDDCSTINTGSCSYDHTLAVDPRIAPQVRYVMRNIYVINQFFSTYWEALHFATTQASLAIAAMVNELDPRKPQGIPWTAILTALSFGLAFLGAPTIAVGILEAEITIAVKIIAQTMLISMMQAPSVSKALFPTGTDDSKTVQIGDLSSELGSTTDQLSQMINNALTLLMTDMPTFVDFVQSGKYSGQDSFSLPNETAGLDIALKTYLVSMAMWGNGWFAQPMIGPFAPSDVTSQYNCSFDDNNVCTNEYEQAFYLSPDTSRLFLLTYKDVHVSRTKYQLTQDLVNNQWAPLNVLFDGAFNCTAKGKANTTDVQFTFNGTLDISCISQLPLYVECNAPCPAPFINGSCPFGQYSYASGDCSQH